MRLSTHKYTHFFLFNAIFIFSCSLSRWAGSHLKAYQIVAYVTITLRWRGQPPSNAYDSFRFVRISSVLHRARLISTTSIVACSGYVFKDSTTDRLFAFIIDVHFFFMQFLVSNACDSSSLFLNETKVHLSPTFHRKLNTEQEKKTRKSPSFPSVVCVDKKKSRSLISGDVFETIEIYSLYARQKHLRCVVDDNEKKMSDKKQFTFQIQESLDFTRNNCNYNNFNSSSLCPIELIIFHVYEKEFGFCAIERYLTLLRSAKYQKWQFWYFFCLLVKSQKFLSTKQLPFSRIEYIWPILTFETISIQFYVFISSLKSEYYIHLKAKWVKFRCYNPE